MAVVDHQLQLSSGRSDHDHGMRLRSPAVDIAAASPGQMQQHGSRRPRTGHSTSSLSKSSTSRVVLQKTQPRRPGTLHHGAAVTIKSHAAAHGPGLAAMMQQQQYQGGMSTTAMSSWSKPGTWYLLNLKTMKPVKSYEQLSRIMQNLGWSFYVTPQRDLWCTWRTCHEADVQHACLPYPDIGAATRIELKRFVRRLEYAGLVGVFDVEAGTLPAARGSRLREDIKAGNVQVSLAVKATNRRIETFKDLAEALVGRGWRRVSDNHFYRFESSPVTPICHVISVIHLPLLRSFRQVCLEDLESIVRLTGSLFYLRFNNALTMNPATLSALQIHKKGVECEEASSLDHESGKKALTGDDLRLWSRITRMLKKYGTTITSNNSPSTLCILLAHKHKTSSGHSAINGLQAHQSLNTNGEGVLAVEQHAGKGEQETFVDEAGLVQKEGVPTPCSAATPHVNWLSSRITRMVRKKKTKTYGRSTTAMTTNPSSFCVKLKHHKKVAVAEEEEEEESEEMQVETQNNKN
ncbi:unnamed protein product [Sphagnum jensenii]|uniref:Uncharacterized protein n=1 Tax=Sphagnum jensenii TaxID=128206 RepID=A0ABP1BVL5_9BRYO